MNLKLKNRSECKYDAVSLGEVMLRLGSGRGKNPHGQKLSSLGRRRRI